MVVVVAATADVRKAGTKARVMRVVVNNAREERVMAVMDRNIVLME